jgi:hypothetical protein
MRAYLALSKTINRGTSRDALPYPGQIGKKAANPPTADQRKSGDRNPKTNRYVQFRRTKSIRLIPSEKG